jgi:hypothetical protein
MCIHIHVCVCVCVPFQLSKQLTDFHEIGTNVTDNDGDIKPYLNFLNIIRTCEYLWERDYNKNVSTLLMFEANTTGKAAL